MRHLWILAGALTLAACANPLTAAKDAFGSDTSQTVNVGQPPTLDPIEDPTAFCIQRLSDFADDLRRPLQQQCLILEELSKCLDAEPNEFDTLARLVREACADKLSMSEPEQEPKRPTRRSVSVRAPSTPTQPVVSPSPSNRQRVASAPSDHPWYSDPARRPRTTAEEPVNLEDVPLLAAMQERQRAREACPRGKMRNACLAEIERNR